MNNSVTGQNERNIRTELLIGSGGVEMLKKARVIVFGAGGVGGYTIEAIARAGVGGIDIVDNDVINESNINRQIYALYSTVGCFKAETAKTRIKDINPDCKVEAYNIFLTPENINDFNLTDYDFVVDAIDNITAKIALAVFCEKHGIKLISCMGTGNKLNPLLFGFADIYKTSVCPLARIMRYELKKRGVKSLKVLYSTEKPIRTEKPPASISFVPSAAGLIIAGEVVRELLGFNTL